MVAKSKAPTTLDEEAEAPAAPAEEAPAPDAPATDAPAEDTKEKKAKKPKKAKKEVAADGDAPAAEGEVEKKKKKKKVIPSWATLSDDVRSKLAKGGALAKPKTLDAIMEAIKMCGDSKGVASASAIKSMVMSENPDLPKMVLKKVLAKAVDKGLVTQVLFLLLLLLKQALTTVAPGERQGLQWLLQAWQGETCGSGEKGGQGPC